MRAATSIMSRTTISVDFPTVPTKSRYVGARHSLCGAGLALALHRRRQQRPFLYPRALAQLIAQPYGGNPAGLPIEDANDFEFDDNNIFSFNQLPGYDLVESGPRANVGFIADALFPGGEVQGLLGQTYRLKPDPIFADFTGETGTASDVVGRVTRQVPASGLHRPPRLRPQQRHRAAA